MPELVRLHRHEHACVVKLDRERKLNAISGEMERELCEALLAPELREAPASCSRRLERVLGRRRPQRDAGSGPGRDRLLLPSPPATPIRRDW